MEILYHSDEKQEENESLDTSDYIRVSCYTCHMTDTEAQVQAIRMEDLKNRKEAYTALFNSLGPEHYCTLEAEYDYAVALAQEGKENESFSHLESAWLGLSKNIYLAYYGQILYDLTFDYAAALYAKGEGEKAIIPITHTLSQSPSDDSNEDIILELNYLLADCLQQSGRDEEARLTLKITYELLLDRYEPGDYLVLNSVFNYVLLLLNQENQKDAMKVLNRHRKLCEEWDDQLAVLILTIYRAFVAKGTPTQAREISKARKLLGQLGDRDESFPVESFLEMLEKAKKGENPDFQDTLM